MPRCVVVEPGAAGRLCRGLSRVMGNYHARFLGGDGAAMRCLYPAPLGLNRQPRRKRSPLSESWVGASIDPEQPVGLLRSGHSTFYVTSYCKRFEAPLAVAFVDGLLDIEAADTGIVFTERIMSLLRRDHNNRQSALGRFLGLLTSHEFRPYADRV